MTTTNCTRCGASLTPWAGTCPACGAPVAASLTGTDEREARDTVRARLADAARAEYEVVSEIGRGGMGWVFLGRDRKLGRLAALKVLPALDAMRPASVERFRREAETAARLSHPHIVPVYGAGGDMGTPYFAMAYVEGESLAERIKAGALPVAEALRVMREVGSALAYAHRQGVVHRDIKPQNILLEREGGRALVADFGISRAAAAERMTHSGVAIGTPGYMAPEQAAGTSDVDGRVDVYALGVVAFEMLTGKRLEDQDSGGWPIATSEARRATRRLRPDLPDGLAEVVARAVAPRREDRWPSVDALLAALEPFAARSAAGGVPWRHRLWWGVAAAGVVVAAAIRMGVLAKGRAGPTPAAAGPATHGIAIMRFDGDTAAADSLLPLLRYQLGGFTAVRVADPRVFAPPGGDPASAEVRAAARRAGASWILHGFVGRSGAGREVQLRLVEVATGHALDLGRLVAPGLDLAVADSVVLRLTQGRAGRELGLAGGASQAPASLEAVRAFDAADDAFRRADYAAAVREYDRVLALDSTFAPARYKRFLADLQQEPTEDRVREAVRGVKGVLPRVGSLEGRLIAAYLMLFDSGRVAEAEDQLRRIVAEDSTFLDGWFALGEVRYHFGAQAGLPPDSAVSAFNRALELWPDAAPAVMHLVSLDLWLDRRTDAEEHIRRYLAADSTSPIGRTLAIGRVVLFGTTGEKRAMLARVGTFADRVLEFGAISGAQTARDRADLASAQLALEEMTRRGRDPRVRSEGARFLVAALLSQGRWRDAEQRLAGHTTAQPGEAELQPVHSWAFLLGYGTADAASRAVRTRLSAPPADAKERAADLWLAGAVAVERGDIAAARAQLNALEGLARTGPPAVGGLRSALAGRIAEAEGDTARAKAAYAAGLNALDPARAPFTLLFAQTIPRFRLTRLRLAAADTAGAFALLEAQDFLAAFADQVVRGPAWLLHGRLLAAHGDTEGATRYFRRAQDLLFYAEPPWTAVRDSARSALVALGVRP